MQRGGGGGGFNIHGRKYSPTETKKTLWQRLSTLLRETRRVTVQNDAFYGASSARAFLRDQLPAQFLHSPRLARPLPSLAKPVEGCDDKPKLLLSIFSNILSIIIAS